MIENVIKISTTKIIKPTISRNDGINKVKKAFQFEKRCATETPATLITNDQTETTKVIRIEIIVAIIKITVDVS